MLTFYTERRPATPRSSTTPTRRRAPSRPRSPTREPIPVSYQVNAGVRPDALRGVALSLAESLASYADEAGCGRPHRGGGRSCARAWPMPSTGRRPGCFRLYGIARSTPREDLIAPFGRPGRPRPPRPWTRRLSAATGRADAVPATVDAAEGLGGRRSRARWPTAPPSLRGGIRFRRRTCSTLRLPERRPGHCARICAPRPTRSMRPMRRCYRQRGRRAWKAPPRSAARETPARRSTAVAGRARAGGRPQADSMAATTCGAAADKLEAGEHRCFPPSAMPTKDQGGPSAAGLHQFHARTSYEANVAPGLASLSRAGRLHGATGRHRPAFAWTTCSASAREAVRLGHLGGRCHGRAPRATRSPRPPRSCKRRLLGPAGRWPPISTRRHRLGRHAHALRAGARLRRVEPFRRRWRAPVGVERIAVFPVENFGSGHGAALHDAGPLHRVACSFSWCSSRQCRTCASQKEAGLVNPKPRAAVLRPLRRHGRGVAGPDRRSWRLGNLFFLARAGDLARWLFMAVLLGRGPCVHVHHLRAGGVPSPTSARPSPCCCSSCR